MVESIEIYVCDKCEVKSVAKGKCLQCDNYLKPVVFMRVGDLLKLREALTEIKKFNPLRNDLDGYLFAMAEWGLGEIEDKPLRKSFGLD